MWNVMSNCRVGMVDIDEFVISDYLKMRLLLKMKLILCYSCEGMGLTLIFLVNFLILVIYFHTQSHKIFSSSYLGLTGYKIP